MPVYWSMLQVTVLVQGICQVLWVAVIKNENRTSFGYVKYLPYRVWYQDKLQHTVEVVFEFEYVQYCTLHAVSVFVLIYVDSGVRKVDGKVEGWAPSASYEIVFVFGMKGYVDCCSQHRTRNKPS